MKKRKRFNRSQKMLVLNNSNRIKFKLNSNNHKFKLCNFLKTYNSKSRICQSNKSSNSNNKRLFHKQSQSSPLFKMCKTYSRTYQLSPMISIESRCKISQNKKKNRNKVNSSSNSWHPLTPSQSSFLMKICNKALKRTNLLLPQ